MPAASISFILVFPLVLYVESDDLGLLSGGLRKLLRGSSLIIEVSGVLTVFFEAVGLVTVWEEGSSSED